MSRITIPATVEAAPVPSQPLLTAVKLALGSVPNLFRLTATSPATLEGYLGLNRALANGSLDAATRERIALAVAEVNGCGYCLAAHSYLAKHLARLDDGEIDANRSATSANPKAAAAVAFAAAIAQRRGAVGDADLAAVRAAGYSDAQLLEIVGHVALNTLTNYINEVFATDVDFPAVRSKVAA
jgi:uncharacterized peroxidase-related enzyme